MENFGWMRDTLAHFEPMAEIVGHVVAAEGQHGHRIAANDADVSGGRGSSFAGRGGAYEDAVLPIKGFVHQRRDTPATAAKNKRGNGHAFRSFPPRRNGGRWRRGHWLARIGMGRGSL